MGIKEALEGTEEVRRRYKRVYGADIEEVAEILEFEASKAPKESAEAVIEWMKEHPRRSSAEGWYVENKETYEPIRFIIKHMVFRGPRDKSDILDFFETFSGLHDTRVDRSGEHPELSVHFD